MKRIGNIFYNTYDMNNLIAAEKKARKGKSHQHGVKLFDRDPKGNLLSLQYMLQNKTYRTSPYTTFILKEKKERLISRLPYFPDRIAHHAIMLPLKPMFMRTFTADTYSCIEKRGTHAEHRYIQRSFRKPQETMWALQLDVVKFFPNIHHDILKQLLRRKLKDRDMLWVLDEIIDSAPGLPIGNYLSQYLSNFYLSYFDHWVKEQLRAPYYLRFCDDLGLFHWSKDVLHEWKEAIKKYLWEKLNLVVRWSIFPIEACGFNMLGYINFQTHSRIRKTTKQNFARMLATDPNPQSIFSYMGLLKHASCNNLTKILLTT
jgi:RNA-directed DNA polymerase